MMKRTDTAKPWWKKRHAKRFINLRNTFEQTIDLEAYPDPGVPIMSVNDNVLSIRNAAHNIRSVYFLPWLIGLWLCLFFIYDDIKPGSTETNYALHRIEMIENGGRSVGPNEYQLHSTMLGKEGKVNWTSYIQAVLKYGDRADREYLIQELIILVTISLVTVLFSIFFIRFPCLAEIYFDRQRGIVYTWRFGKIAACKFENLGFREDNIGLTLFLYGESKKHESGYWPVLFGLQPTGKAHMNSEDDNTFLMAQLFAFMDKGKQAVITEDKFKREQPGTYIFVDKKPKDFDARLAEILKREYELPEIYAKHTF
ncbi:hypothetical protein [Vibrio campbellii]|uniref:hypothetical protein n=1 Tax=Vibrio campbellii TaxID=680 RepID=UPI00210E0AE4|nr:hypothetical protein [Vibrio campbellii]UTZ21897.1 hypothetical protein HB760_08205 [Vibrio campbellii]UTZ41428.1 hypothetical protein HB764_08470 [Vibrio campbellii]